MLVQQLLEDPGVELDSERQYARTPLLSVAERDIETDVLERV